MKSLNKVLSILLIFGLGACSDYLNEDLQGIYSNATFYQSETHALLAITGVYNAASFVSTDNDLWVFGDVASDDATKGGLAGDQSDIQFIDEFTYSRNNGSLEKIWRRYYEGISRANYLLYYGPDISMDIDLKNRILGEAKFLRAYFYFNLVNIFGEVPIKLNPPINPDEINKPKSAIADVYDQIENDLQDAIAVLEVKYSGPDVGRATKGAALGMLAKVGLFQQRWDDVLTAVSALDALANYGLEEVYKNNFLDSTQNNKESLFELQHLSGQAPKLGSHLDQYFSPAKDNGYYFNVPLQDFVDAFEVTAGNVPDPRLDYTVGRIGQKWVNGEDFDPAWSPTGYLQKKHVQPLREEPIIGDASLNYVYLRYADILLMKAEALNELSRTTEALLPLNAVRKRARECYLFDTELPDFGTVPADLLPDITDSNQQTVREAIRQERRVELGFEFHRFFDLMRYGQAAAESALAGTGFNYALHRYFLIPQSELDTNPFINN
ncbi:MAG: RagB/SusD family nutrient uptake outer membrane protein [Cyclobacteriaceae bacterium]|nr:RagB/SusD family nutrient uptake outer membrane protein [Cyclobacteriaceae bacterium]MDH4295978.1 RagB/SusD family nutrient uptake outer membrane protein [Cyclobacteriaceae bacterium]MDH5248822.1 RagB/SusD family nutrient uptake outer membrane protein [Cyclobacteriaceae bacterium]